MPLAPLLITILTTFAGSLIARLLLGAGLAIFTFSWINDLVADVRIEIATLWGGLPADVLGLASILKIPQAISVLISALVLAAFIKTTKLMIGKVGS